MSTQAMARSTTSYVVRDSVTMLRRNLLHWLRYPSLAIMLVAQPIVFLLLFVYVFGGTLGAGLPGVPGGGDRGDYLVFITPGILIMAVASVALGTAIEVALDMTGGIIARFRTMDIAKVSVLTGHVLGAVLKTMLAVAVTLAVALLLGYRSECGARGLAGRARPAGPDGVRVHLADRRDGAGRRQRGDREQHPDVPGDAAVPEQRVRARPTRCRGGCASSRSTSRSPR